MARRDRRRLCRRHNARGFKRQFYFGSRGAMENNVPGGFVRFSYYHLLGLLLDLKSPHVLCMYIFRNSYKCVIRVYLYMSYK